MKNDSANEAPPRRDADASSPASKGFLPALIASGLLLCALAWQSIATLAPGMDEVAHVGAARFLNETGSNRLNPEHPVLVKRLVGAAIASKVSGDGAKDAALDQWEYGRATLTREGRLDQELLIIARLPLLGLALLGLVIVGLFARRMSGTFAAMVAMAVYAASPAVLTGASMVLTDLPVGVFGLGACYFAWRAATEGRPGYGALAGFAAAAAALAKYSGVMVAPLALALVGLELLLFQRDAARRAPAVSLAFGLGLLFGWWLIGGGTGPAEYVEGMRSIGANHAKDYPYYAFGRYSGTGFWWYFPAALGVKSTVPELFGLVALALAPWLFLRGAARSGAMRSAGLWLAAWPGAYLLALMVAAPDVGHRYLAPLYPCACVALSVALAGVRRRVLFGAVLVTVQVASALSALPDPMSYFNGIAGCRGVFATRCLDDSNVDWGQNLNRVWAQVAHRLGPEEALRVDVVSSMPLSAFLPRYRVIQSEDWVRSEPGLYLISAHNLVRRQALIHGIERTALLQHLDPADHIGNNYFVVDLRPTPAR